MILFSTYTAGINCSSALYAIITRAQFVDITTLSNINITKKNCHKIEHNYLYNDYYVTFTYRVYSC